MTTAIIATVWFSCGIVALFNPNSTTFFKEMMKPPIVLIDFQLTIWNLFFAVMNVFAVIFYVFALPVLFLLIPLVFIVGGPISLLASKQ